MGRIRKILQSLFARPPIVRQEGKEIRETVTAGEDKDLLAALRLRKTVEDGRLFLRPGLSLADVAAKMNMDADALGGVFTRFIGKDFALYLDELRVAYAAVLFMGQESHLYSIEKIGTVCGFPDNTAFGDACFRLTSMTPELMREFTRSRNTLKGLFLKPPIYLTAISSDTNEEILSKHKSIVE